MKLLLPLVASLFLLQCFLLDEADACCKNKKVGECCGNGKCNIFCCNCDNGCNTLCETDYNSYLDAIGALLGRRKRSLIEERQTRKAALDYFVELDSDSDGVISLDEAVNGLKKQGNELGRVERSAETPEWFLEMDANGNGKIEPLEFDYRLENF